MGVSRSSSLLAVGALVAVTLSGVTPTADAGSASSQAAFAASPGKVVRAMAPARSTRSAREVRRYWTPDRMAAALPIEQLVPSLTVSGTDDGAPTVRPTATGREQVRVPRSAGKLFFVVDGFDAVCTASAIMTERRNQVITAGHCVHTGPNVGLLQQPHFYSDWVFVPRYRNGRAPLGEWVSTNAWAFNGWIENESFKFDQAIIAFARLDGRRLVNEVGGNEVVWGKDPRQWGTRIWGWPAEDPYDGETPQRCDGRTTPFEDSADAAMSQCDLNGGASGGPWYLPRGRTANTGRIWAVTSRRVIADPILLARPIPSEIRRMIRVANH